MAAKGSPRTAISTPSAWCDSANSKLTGECGLKRVAAPRHCKCVQRWDWSQNRSSCQQPSRKVVAPSPGRSGLLSVVSCRPRTLGAALGRFVASYAVLRKSDGTTVGGHLLEAHVRPTLGHVRLDRHRGWIAAGIGLAAGAALALLTGPGSRRSLSA